MRLYTALYTDGEGNGTQAAHCNRGSDHQAPRLSSRSDDGGPLPQGHAQQERRGSLLVLSLQLPHDRRAALAGPGINRAALARRRSRASAGLQTRCPQARSRESITGKALPVEQHNEALAVVQAFDRAAGVKPWEYSPLSPHGDGPLQAALLAKLTEAEAEAWRSYARKWWKERDAEMAEGAAALAAAARRRLKVSPAP